MSEPYQTSRCSIWVQLDLERLLFIDKQLT